MSYWNQSNFEGMRAVGEKYAGIPGYARFGSYCLQKEQGLKKQALASINAFVAELLVLPAAQQRAMAAELSALSFYNPQIHQLIAHPLMVCIQQVLQHWATEEPSNVTPHKWLGHMARDLACYERALALDPDDDICLSQVADACLSHIDYQTHHLSESLFIGELSDARSCLDKAQALVARMGEGELKHRLQQDLLHFTRLLDLWQAYSTSATEQSFAHWCQSCGYPVELGSVVYVEPSASKR